MMSSSILVNFEELKNWQGASYWLSGSYDLFNLKKVLTLMISGMLSTFTVGLLKGGQDVLHKINYFSLFKYKIKCAVF